MFILSLVLFPLTVSSQKDLSQFDYLGLEVFNLSPQDEELSQWAQKISNEKLAKMGIIDTQPLNRVKRGYKKKSKQNNPGYYALPIPQLPTNVDQDQVRFLTRPNRKLIRMANEIVQKRNGGVLPPTVNNIPPKEGPHVNDPFILTPVSDSGGYPNSIQDVLSQIHEKPPSDGNYPPPYDPPDTLKYPPFTHKPTTQPPKKKKVYKVVHTKPPKVEHGTTKKTVYKLVTEKPKIIYHTRKPITEDPRIYDHTIPPEPFPTSAPYVPPSPPHKAKPVKKKPDEYMAVIPYHDVYKLFEMLNKHTKPYDEKKMKKKMKKVKSTPPTLPPPTTKRTEILQPKVIKRTPLKGKKKKKTVHVSVKMN